MITSGTETNIRVVFRTRPTQNFANKNISLDNIENVNSLKKNLILVDQNKHTEIRRKRVDQQPKRKLELQIRQNSTQRISRGSV